MHYFDAHDPYGPPRRYLQLGAHPGASPFDFLKRTYLYDADVAYLDEKVGRLVEFLISEDILNHTIVIVIADHGEGLGDHNFVGHTFRLFNEQLHVPFFIRYPPGLPQAHRVNSQVRSIDLSPTLLELVGLPQPTSIEGESLLPLLQHPPSHIASQSVKQ